MPTCLHLTNTCRRSLPLEFRENDVRFPEILVEHFMNEVTQAGDIVLDPFAGFGTTLLVAESLGRVGYGIEINESKVLYVKGLLQHPERLICGDARSLTECDLPLIDLCLTSPPYTTRTDQEDPFTDYRKKGKGYTAYLQDIGNVFRQVSRRMRSSAHAVIEIANIKNESGVTTLAWDVADVVSKILHFKGEIVVCWDHYGYGYDHSYCLVFSKAGETG